MADLTPSEIRDRITMTVACTAPELVGTIKLKVSGYVSQLEKSMADCKICGGITVQCPNCLKADEVLVWIQNNLKRIDKELEGR